MLRCCVPFLHPCALRSRVGDERATGGAVRPHDETAHQEPQLSLHSAMLGGCHDAPYVLSPAEGIFVVFQYRYHFEMSLSS